MNAKQPPTDAARALARAGLGLDADAARDLIRLLAHSLAVPPAAERREARLGLLITLIGDTGRIPKPAEYDEARRQAPDPWPDRSTLSAAYGNWRNACAAAMRQADPRSHPNGKRRPPVSDRGSGGRVRRFSRQEVIAAILRFHAEHDRQWPGEHELTAWGRHLRAHARATAGPDPRIPTSRALRREFGTYPNAVAAANRELDHRC